MGLALPLVRRLPAASWYGSAGASYWSLSTVVVWVVVEVWKPQVAVLEPLHAEADRQPTGGEVHGEVQIPAAVHQAVLQRIDRRASGGFPFRRRGGR
jgi:hypothetical protein